MADHQPISATRRRAIFWTICRTATHSASRGVPMCQGHIGDVGDDKHGKHGASSMVSQCFWDLLGLLGHFWRLIILITEYVPSDNLT